LDFLPERDWIKNIRFELPYKLSGCGPKAGHVFLRLTRNSLSIQFNVSR
jgi:hypothetical protein